MRIAAERADRERIEIDRKDAGAIVAGRAAAGIHARRAPDRTRDAQRAALERERRLAGEPVEEQSVLQVAHVRAGDEESAACGCAGEAARADRRQTAEGIHFRAAIRRRDRTEGVHRREREVLAGIGVDVSEPTGEHGYVALAVCVVSPRDDRTIAAACDTVVPT